MSDDDDAEGMQLFKFSLEGVFFDKRSRADRIAEEIQKILMTRFHNETIKVRSVKDGLL